MNQTEFSDKRIKNIARPILPQNDKRSYRVLTLINDMKVTLIHDPYTDKSAVALDVYIGSMSDPRNVMGLAHFCEHMVFMGSKKFPEENYYSKYLSQNNGSYNAYTSSDHTNFYFEINPANLLECMDIFAQFFIEPLFTNSATDREMQAVNSEHEKNLVDDFWRLLQLDRHLSDKNHSFNMFSTGSLKTLKEDPEANGIDVRQALLDFHKKYYSSNIMTLCVLGKESLEVMEKNVLELFSAVSNVNAEVPSWTTSPWTDDTLQNFVFIEPVQENYELFFVWPIPDYSKLYKSKPYDYVNHLIGHEAEGSTLAYLKKKRWAESLGIFANTVAEGVVSLCISIRLFDDGMNHIKEIVTIIYQYIRILCETEPEKWIFEEMKKLNEINFRFKETSALEFYVSQITSHMHMYEPEHIIQGPYILNEFRPDLIKSVIDCLRPRKMKIFCSSPAYKEKVNEEEPWYKTKYIVENFSDEEIKIWENVPSNDELFLPVPNPFIAEDFSIKSADTADNTTSSSCVPVIYKDSPMCRWWFCPDSDYRLPKGFVTVGLTNNLSSVDPVYYMMKNMLVDLFNEYINKSIYDAILASLGFRMGVTFHGFELSFEGFNDKMPNFVKFITDKLAAFTTNEETFEVIKLSLFRSYRNYDKESPLFQAHQFLRCLVTDVFWTHQECLNTLKDITFEKYKSFFQLYFSRIFTEGLIYGNFIENDADAIVKFVEDSFSSAFDIQPLLGSQLPMSRYVLLPKDSRFVFHVLNDHQPTSAIIIYLQGLPVSTHNDVLTKLTNLLLEEPLFNKLRTEEQLGYIVGNIRLLNNSSQGILIKLQSMKRPDILDARVDNFLEHFQKTLQEMSDNEFEKYVLALKESILERPKNMSKKFSKLRHEFDVMHYNFKRAENEVEELKNLKKQDVINYFQSLLQPESKSLGKMSIYVTASKTHGKEFHEYCQHNTKITVIKDISRFKRSLPLNPIFEALLPSVATESL